MFRELRRFKQALSREECEEILSKASHGVLSVYGTEGYPYAVPVNHVWFNGKLAFHCAKEGHKIDAIRLNPNVCFSVVGESRVISEKRTTAYTSVIVFGEAKIVNDEAEMRLICERIGEKFCPNNLEDCRKETESSISSGRLCCVEIRPEHISGKCGREILASRLLKLD